MIAKLDKQFLKELRDDIDAALAPLGAKHGLSLKAGNAAFSETTATFKLQVCLKTSSGEAITQERQNYIAYADTYGLKPEWLDQTFSSESRVFKIVGLLPRRSKNPVLCRTENGKEYVFSVELVKLLAPKYFVDKSA
jgi:hypothetical protein